MEANATSGMSGILTYVVTRCGCDDPLSHAKLNLPCPTPRAIEEAVTIEIPPRSTP